MYIGNSFYSETLLSRDLFICAGYTKGQRCRTAVATLRCHTDISELYNVAFHPMALNILHFYFLFL